ncbi:hypothetical protein ALI22I_25385 [Saccharothrix sp. ALI-22-I]|nr:hypothetical protein ALI22I_25385 [Saccharothrix sp. ALI-22-I]
MGPSRRRPHSSCFTSSCSTSSCSTSSCSTPSCSTPSCSTPSCSTPSCSTPSCSTPSCPNPSFTPSFTTAVFTTAPGSPQRPVVHSCAGCPQAGRDRAGLSVFAGRIKTRGSPCRGTLGQRRSWVAGDGWPVMGGWR